MTKLEADIGQQARIALSEGRDHACVMQSGNCLAFEIASDELERRLRGWLPVVGASEGEAVSLLIKACSNFCAWILADVGLTVNAFMPVATGGSNVH